MRKGLIFVLGIISFLGINTVSAKEIYLEYDSNINNVKTYIDTIGYEKLNNSITEIINYYNENYSNEFPYYYISLWKNGFGNFTISLRSFTQLDYSFNAVFYSYSDSIDYRLPMGGDVSTIEKTYDTSTANFSDIVHSLGSYSNSRIFHIQDTTYYYNPYSYYYSNFDYYYKGELLKDLSSSYLVADDVLYIPSLKDSTRFFKYQANTNFLIEPYYLYDNNDSFVAETYTEINLNEYAYVALSLKDYNTIPENNFSLYTNMYVKGQVCITPVYNYGLTERKDILTGTQIEGCGSYYLDFTLDKMYILRDDVKNHAIYYLKPYDTSKENVIKIDSSKFNITYISEANASNPQVDVNGKVYPSIPYDELTDTSTKSEDEGYVPGASCSFGDFNCFNQYNPENLFDEVFSSPLELLESVWSAISTIFSLIGEFISLLPVPMQTFLYLSFMIAVVLGLLKIIL